MAFEMIPTDRPAKPIKVIDAPCGAGKTSWAIQMMNAGEGPFMFVTPFLDEVTRIRKDCPRCNFVEPMPDRKAGRHNKRASLKEHLANGRNIVTTHKLFQDVDQDAVELVRLGGYTLILDEVMDVITHYDTVSRKDIEMLLDKGLLAISDDGQTLRAPEGVDYTGRLQDVIRLAALNRLILVNENVLLWLFPVDVLEAFDEVWNLTYMFHGQIQKYYYDLHRLHYEYFAVSLDSTGGRYVLHNPEPSDDFAFRASVQKLVNIYLGKLNRVGDDPRGLSYNWFNKQGKAVLEMVGRNIRNFFLSVGAKGKAALWTCFNPHRAGITGHRALNGFSSCHLAHNARAVNSHRHKSALAYCVNKFPAPEICNFFQATGVQVDKDAYALSSLIQWLFRSRLRKMQPVDLFIPSRRMRQLLEGWLNPGVVPD